MKIPAIGQTQKGPQRRYKEDQDDDDKPPPPPPAPEPPEGKAKAPKVADPPNPSLVKKTITKAKPKMTVTKPKMPEVVIDGAICAR